MKNNIIKTFRKINESVILLSQKKFFKIFIVMFSFIIAIGLAIYHEAMYQSADDWDMKILLDGTAGGIKSKPQEFSLFMNIIYGKILNFFYNIIDFYWFDLFYYIFLSASTFVITLFIVYRIKDWLVSILAMFMIALLSSVAFVSPQFTMVSGFLAISGVVSFYMFVQNYFDKKYNFLLILYFMLSLLFSSFIRFNCCLLVSLYTGIILLPFWPYKNLKQLLTKSILIVVVLMVIVLCQFYNVSITKKNANWYEIMLSNTPRSELTDKTDMWTRVSDPWKNVEGEAQNVKHIAKFSPGYYRLLMTTGMFGNSEVFNYENLRKVDMIIGEKVKRFNSIYAGIRLADWYGYLKYIYFAFFIILFINARKWQQYYILFCFFTVVWILNIFFRELPPRLWYNLALATILVMLLNWDFKKTIKNKLSLIILIIVSFNIVNIQSIYIDYRYKSAKILRKEIKHLANDLYLVDFMMVEATQGPFKKNPFLGKNVIWPSQMSQEKRYIDQLQKFDISQNDTWLNICSKDSKVKFLASPLVPEGYLQNIKKAVSYFMKEKYGKIIYWEVKHPFPHLITYQCRILTDKELWLRKKYKEEVRDVFETEYGMYLYAEKYGKNIKEKSDIINYLNSVRTSDWRMLKVEFAYKYLGKNATSKQIDKLLELMEAEVLEENKKVK